jgi:hypothetical protein
MSRGGLNRMAASAALARCPAYNQPKVALPQGHDGLFLSGKDCRQPYQGAEDTHHAGHPHYDALKACSFLSSDISS